MNRSQYRPDNDREEDFADNPQNLPDLDIPQKPYDISVNRDPQLLKGFSIG